MASYSTAGTAQWQPGVVYLLVLLAVEIIVMGVLRTMTKHGG